MGRAVLTARSHRKQTYFPRTWEFKLMSFSRKSPLMLAWVSVYLSIRSVYLCLSLILSLSLSVSPTLFLSISLSYSLCLSVFLILSFSVIPLQISLCCFFNSRIPLTICNFLFPFSRYSNLSLPIFNIISSTPSVSLLMSLFTSQDNAPVFHTNQLQKLIHGMENISPSK